MKPTTDKPTTRTRRRRRSGAPVVVRVEVEIEPGGRAWTRTGTRATRHDSGPRRAIVGELIEDVIWHRHT